MQHDNLPTPELLKPKTCKGCLKNLIKLDFYPTVNFCRACMKKKREKKKIKEYSNMKSGNWGFNANRIDAHLREAA